MTDTSELDKTGRDSERLEHGQLQQLIKVVVYTSIPTLMLSIYIALDASSLSVSAVILDSSIALMLNFVSLLVLRIVRRGNVFQFPYGTGKLENFASFLHGCGILLVGGTILYHGVMRLNNPPVQVSLGLAQIALGVGWARLIFIVSWLARIVRRYPQRSPLLNAYHVNFITALWYVSGLMVAMMIGWLLAYRWGNSVALAADLLIAAGFSVYLIWNGVQVVRSNFRALLDLPLPEQDQLVILGILTRHFSEYANLGNILTRYSGGHRRVEIEFSFAPETTAGHIEALDRQIHAELKQHFGKIEFSLIVRCL